MAMEGALDAGAAISVAGGLAAGLGSNVVGIPLDQFRVVVAQDASMASGLYGHLRATASSLSTAYTGGVARVAMKGLAASLNLSTPQQVREANPFLANFACGIAFSPVLNVPRMLQLAKINGESYARASARLFTTGAGLRTFSHNTFLFAPGEGLRMMMCFGTKDWLKPRMTSSAPSADGGVARRALWLAAVVGPLVSVVETSAALANETASTLHAKLGSVDGAARSEVLRAAMQPRYIGRCWLALFVKNIAANSISFFFMFWADEMSSMQARRVTASPTAASARIPSGQQTSTGWQGHTTVTQ